MVKISPPSAKDKKIVKQRKTALVLKQTKMNKDFFPGKAIRNIWQSN